MSKHFRTNVIRDNEGFELDASDLLAQQQGSFGDRDPGVTYLDDFGYCPVCRMGPFGPGVYVCENPRCTED